jgi:hypothetical protein
MRVIRLFAAAKWSGYQSPGETRQYFLKRLLTLEQRLRENRLAGKRLDEWWGRIGRSTVAEHLAQGVGLADAVQQWWEAAAGAAGSGIVEEIKKAVMRCRQTKAAAEDDPADPWASLSAWAIRHNRPAFLPNGGHEGPVARREHRPGGDIAGGDERPSSGVAGISLGADEAAPFFVAARAQGELVAPSIFASGASDR